MTKTTAFVASSTQGIARASLPILEDAKIGPSIGYDNPQQPDVPDLRAVVFVIVLISQSHCLSLVRPSLLRCLFTERAAISSARSSERPRSFSLSLTCLYCLSSLSLQAFGMICPPGSDSLVSYEPHWLLNGQLGTTRRNERHVTLRWQKLLENSLSLELSGSTTSILLVCQLRIRHNILTVTLL